MDREEQIAKSKILTKEAEQLKKEVISLIDSLREKSLSADSAKVRDHHLHTNNIILNLLLAQQKQIQNLTSYLALFAQSAVQTEKAVTVLLATKIDEMKRNRNAEVPAAVENPIDDSNT